MEAVSQKTEGQKTVAKEALLEFQVEGITYTLPAHEVKGIVEVHREEVYPLPVDQEPLLGMFNLQGQVYVLVRFPGAEKDIYHKGKTLCIVFGVKQMKAAFAASQISQVQESSEGKALTAEILWQQMSRGVPA